MTRVVLALLFLACTDPAALPPPNPAPTPTPTPAATPTPQNVDVRVDFDEGPDPDYGQNTTSVRAWLVVPALGVRKKVFTVPAPYTCGRGAGVGPDLVVECKGSDDSASVNVHVEGPTLVVVARDYGRIDQQRTRDEIPLPRGASATLFAPARFPITQR